MKEMWEVIHTFPMVKYGQLWTEHLCFSGESALQFQAVNDIFECLPKASHLSWPHRTGLGKYSTAFFISLCAEQYTRCFGEGCQKVYIWCIDMTAYSILALDLFS